MIQEVDAVYENGLLRPLKPLLLNESQQVHVLVTDSTLPRTRPDAALRERARLETGGGESVPTIEELRDMLSVLPGSLSEDIMSERGEY